MEKQGTVENQLAHTIDQTEYDSRYDRTAKKLLANKQILAQIMKGCVNEYSVFLKTVIRPSSSQKLMPSPACCSVFCSVFCILLTSHKWTDPPLVQPVN